MHNRRIHTLAVVHVAQLDANAWIVARTKKRGATQGFTSRKASNAESSYGRVRVRVTKMTGAQSDGIVLSTNGLFIRVAIPGCDDAAEFFWQSGQWYSEDGDKASIEFFAIEDYEPDLLSALCIGTAPSSFCGTPIRAWAN